MVLTDIVHYHGPRGLVVQQSEGMCEMCDKAAEMVAYNGKGKEKKK
jgi:hypothetical protein